MRVCFLKVARYFTKDSTTAVIDFARSAIARPIAPHKILSFPSFTFSESPPEVIKLNPPQTIIKTERADTIVRNQIDALLMSERTSLRFFKAPKATSAGKRQKKRARTTKDEILKNLIKI